jgi:hypothetical protein
LSVTKLRPGQVTITRASVIGMTVVFDIVSGLLACLVRPLQRIDRPPVKTSVRFYCATPPKQAPIGQWRRARGLK